MRLYLVRHARPLVREGMCYGSTDLAADEGHQQQALIELVRRLPARTPLLSSPMQRCRSLATLLTSALHAGAPVFDSRLAEMDFGAWEMRAWDAIPRAEIDAWAAELATHRPGGGESLIDVARRVRAFYDELQATKPACTIVVAHAGTIRLLLAAAQSASVEQMVSIAAQTPNNIGYGELTTIDC